MSFSYHPSEKTLQTELRSEDYLPGAFSGAASRYGLAISPKTSPKLEAAPLTAPGR